MNIYDFATAEADPPQWLARPDGQRLAYHYSPATSTDKRPDIMFCGGFMSNMAGGKAQHLEAACRGRGQGFVRFDYRGHGQSTGRFADATIGEWIGDALAVFDAVPERPVVLVGSSMGAWIAVHVALARPERVTALVTVAAAADLTEDLLPPRLSAEQRDALARNGVIRLPTDYDDQPYVITQRLLDEGRNHLVLRGPIALSCPVRMIHGLADADVPWRQSVHLADALQSEDVHLTLVKDGEHRMSRDQDLAMLDAAVCAVSAGEGR